MREILFRGKDPGGKWVYGFLVPTIKDSYSEGFEIIDTDGIEYDELDGYHPTFCSDPVDPETVGQYIGIRDVKGNKIFEGDVLASTTNGKQTKTRVLLVISDIRKCTNTEMWVHGMKFAVIGNVHDNPEFMEAYKESANSGGLVTWED